MTEIAQGTDEWKALRLGRVTASRVADVMAKTKTGYSASRDAYMAQLICERLTGQVAESFKNAAMIHGTETEPLARAAYETFKDVLVDEVAFIEHPTIPMSGASPDGMIGDDGLVEIKSPQTNTHIEVLLSKKVPGKYITQIQWQLACTGRKWCDFVSFDPRMPEDLQLFVTRVERDDEKIAELEAGVIEFLNEVDQKIATLKGEK
jgi:putative phage-type endonuclease